MCFMFVLYLQFLQVLYCISSPLTFPLTLTSLDTDLGKQGACPLHNLTRAQVFGLLFSYQKLMLKGVFLTNLG